VGLAVLSAAATLAALTATLAALTATLTALTALTATLTALAGIVRISHLSGLLSFHVNPSRHLVNAEISRRVRGVFRHPSLVTRLQTAGLDF
jgi:hypothetical protein